MSDMFTNYPQPVDYVPNNRHRKFHKNEIAIMAGETTIHSFEIPFNVNEDTIDFGVIYKLGLNVVLTKNKKDCTVDYDSTIGKTFITCVLSNEDSMLFKDTLLDAHVQIRFTMNDLSTTYTEIYPIKLIDSLDVAEIKPIPPHTLVGIGYTED